MFPIKIPVQIEVYNQMLEKKERKSQHVYVHLEKEHVRFSIENAQEDFKFFRAGQIEDLHIEIPIAAIKRIAGLFSK